MRKALILLSFILVFAATASSASAATISFSPATGGADVGNAFSLNVYIVPSAGEKIFTAKASIAYPAGLLEARSFSFAQNTFPLAQSGYDRNDTAAGVLIKTAGFPGGITGTTLLGTVTFYAKAAGSADIRAASDSEILNDANQNAFTGGNTARYSIAAPAVQTSPVITTPPSEIKKSPPPSPQNLNAKPAERRNPTSAPTSASAAATSTAPISRRDAEEAAELPEPREEQAAAVANAIPANDFLTLVLTALLSLSLGFVLGLKARSLPWNIR